MKKVVKILIDIAREEKLIFPLHNTTLKALEKFDLLNEIANNPNIEIIELLSYFKFINLIKNAKYLITDGGGPQEESYYLGVPCLVLRETAERVWRNTCVVGLDETKIHSFLENIEKYRFPVINDKYSPSEKIVDLFERLNFI